MLLGEKCPNPSEACIATYGGGLSSSNKTRQDKTKPRLKPLKQVQEEDLSEWTGNMITEEKGFFFGGVSFQKHLKKLM